MNKIVFLSITLVDTYKNLLSFSNLRNGSEKIVPMAHGL